MIKGITGNNGIHVSMPYNQWPNFSTYNSNQLGAGNMRYNGGTQAIEVFDGNTWLQLHGVYTNIELDGNAKSVIAWAMAKMAEEHRLEELARKHPSVADAIEGVKKAEEQVRIVAALVDNV
jgi:hypothetical protein